jgi:hypothetical protein
MSIIFKETVNLRHHPFAFIWKGKIFFLIYLERILSENEEEEVFLYRLFKVMLHIENKTPQYLSCFWVLVWDCGDRWLFAI